MMMMNAQIATLEKKILRWSQQIIRTFLKSWSICSFAKMSNIFPIIAGHFLHLKKKKKKTIHKQIKKFLNIFL